MNLITQQAELLKMALDATTAMTGHLDGEKIGLYQTDLALNNNMAYATLDAAKATYDGYAAKTITWLTPSVADDGTVEVIGTVTVFKPTGSVTPNVLYGCYLYDSGGTRLDFVGRFDPAPVPMGSTLDNLLLTVRYRPGTNSLVVEVT